MGWEPIHKTEVPRVAPNLGDYAGEFRDFSWQAARGRLAGLPGGGGLNIAYEAVDRHATGPRAHQVALRCRDRRGAYIDLTYEDLRRRTNRFANLLRKLGVGRSERVFTLMGRVPELYVTGLGTVKNTSVFSPLFPAFGPEPVRDRLRLGDARVLVCTPELYRRRVAALRDSVPTLEHVLLVGDRRTGDLPGTLDLAAELESVSDEFVIPPTDPEDMALLHFTSGTTGKPKGARCTCTRRWSRIT